MFASTSHQANQLITWKQPLDTTSPEISDKARSNYIVGFPWTLVQADAISDYANLNTRLCITNQVLIHQIHSSLQDNNNTGDMLDSVSIQSKSLEHNLITAIQKDRSSNQTQSHLTRANFAAALDPLAEAPSTCLAASTAMTASSLDREFSIIVTDIAPYVRSIAAHDLTVEQQRIRVSNLLSAGGGAKKMRMTRASRSAVEGGSRQTTRREKWFDKSLNLGLVLRTAGKGWDDVLKTRSSGHMESVRSMGGESTWSAELETGVVRVGQTEGLEDAMDELREPSAL